MSQRFCAAVLLLLLAAPAAVADLYALFLTPGQEAALELDPERFQIRPLPEATLVLSKEPGPWPNGLEPHAALGDELLFLVDAHGHDLAQQGVEFLEQIGDLRLLRVQPGAIEPLMSRAHGERLAWTQRRQPRADAFALPKQPVDPGVKAALVDAVDAAAFEQFVRELAGVESFLLNGLTTTIVERNTYRDGVDVAADYLEDRLDTWGYTVSRQDFLVGATPAQNIVAEKTGSVSPDEIVVIGAHFDTISNLNNSSGPAPGAEDNGSGTAAVMHLAEIFADYNSEKTIHFVLFGGEEQGLWGSEHYVANIPQSDTVLAALTMDMMSAHQETYGIDIEGWADGHPCDCWPLMQQFQTEINAVSPGLATQLFAPGFGSDHVPFADASIPVLLAIESDWASYPGYHRTTDTVEKLDYTYGSLVIRGMAAMLAELSVPSEKVAVLLSGFELDPSSGGVLLRWHLSSDEPGALRIDRATDAGPFAMLPGARWSLSEAPSQYLDPGIPGAELHYRLVLERVGGDELLAERSTKLPSSFVGGLRLEPAEPNPFGSGGGTLLRFQLPQPGQVSLDVYDAAGRHLRRLLGGRRDAGPQAVRWDGRDRQGRPLASGIYFIRLSSGFQQQTRRLTLLGDSR